MMCMFLLLILFNLVMFNLLNLSLWIFYFFMVIFLFLSFGLSMNKNFFMMYNFFLMDKMSFWLIFLTLWIFCLSIFSMNLTNKKKNQNIYILNLFMLLMLLITSFLVSNLTWFFFLFESSLMPTFYLILGWGMKIERVQAGYYMLFYTIFGSMPLMITFGMIYKLNYSMNYFLMKIFNNQIFLFMCFNLPFLMKLPMFLFHSWLPKAHVEAPISGSMILAGVLLKMGGYGLIRFNSIFFLKMENLISIFSSISLIGGILSSLVCLRQTDLKSLVAYSSVSHMSLVINSIFSYLNWGILGSVMMMISHGFCSSSLFILVNFNYERILSRSMLFNKGFMSMLPSLSLWWFLTTIINMAFPPSLNLISEIFMLSSIFSWSFLSILYLFLMPFLSGMYNMNLFCVTQHGKMMISNNYFFFSNFMREMLIMFSHLIFLILFFMKMDLLI